MDLEDIQEQINKLEGSEKEKQAILKLIKIKTDSDMDKVLNAIGVTNNAISVLKSETNASIGSLKESHSNIKWILTGIGAIALVILGKLFNVF